MCTFGITFKLKWMEKITNKWHVFNNRIHDWFDKFIFFSALNLLFQWRLSLVKAIVNKLKLLIILMKYWWSAYYYYHVQTFVLTVDSRLRGTGGSNVSAAQWWRGEPELCRNSQSWYLPGERRKQQSVPFLQNHLCVPAQQWTRCGSHL